MHDTMNKKLLFLWLLEAVDRNANSFYKKKRRKLEDILWELNGRRDVMLPTKLSEDPHAMLTALREHFEDRVTLISLVMHHYFPRRYLFYRHSQLESELFEGFAFFAEIEPLFEFSFQSIGRSGIERYLVWNERMLEFVQKHWRKQRKQGMTLVAYFLYQGLARMFLTENDYRRYWVVITKEHDRLEAPRVVWAGRKEMQKGDLVFAYRTAPVSAFTDVFHIAEEPSFDPWGAWHGFWVKMERVASFPAITFSKMKKDSVLRRWGLVRRQFQGSVEAMPHVIYNRLLANIPDVIRSQHHLQPEIVAGAPQSGEFTSESDFEERVIIPLLRQWGFRFHRQYLCEFQIGSQRIRGRIDFLVEDAYSRPVTLFEDKFRILNEMQLHRAVAQAKSYALQLGIPSFVVASPEGLWLFELRSNHHHLIMQLPTPKPGDDIRQIENLRHAILALVSSQT